MAGKGGDRASHFGRAARPLEARFAEDRPRVVDAGTRRDSGRERDDDVERRSVVGWQIDRHRVPSPIRPLLARVDRDGHLPSPRRAWGGRHLHADRELDARRMLLPDLRRDRAGAEEARAVGDRHPILDTRRRVTQKCFERSMTKVDRADPANCQRLLAMLEPPSGRRRQPKRQRPLAKVVDRAPGSGRRPAGEQPRTTVPVVQTG